MCIRDRLYPFWVWTPLDEYFPVKEIAAPKTILSPTTFAYDIYKSRPKDINTKDISDKSFFSFYKDGFLVAGTSPKAWMFFPFIFPQFIDFNSNYIIQFIILITTYVVLDFLSLVGYAILANKLIIWIKANPKIINTISACVIILIAIIIAFTQQY